MMLSDDGGGVHLSVGVSRGDTLWSLSQRLGVPIDAIKRRPGLLREGDVVRIPLARLVRRRCAAEALGLQLGPKAALGIRGVTASVGGWDRKDVDVYLREKGQRVSALLRALRDVETSSCALPAPKGDGGLSIGPLQIGRMYHADAWCGRGSYARCEELDYSERTCLKYWLRYAATALRFGPDFAVLSRVHNGGPRGLGWAPADAIGCGGEAAVGGPPLKTGRYWAKVRRALAAQDRAGLGAGWTPPRSRSAGEAPWSREAPCRIAWEWSW